MRTETELLSRSFWDKTWSRFLRHQGMIAPSAKLIQHMVQLVPRHGLVLDLGCGEGRNTIYLARIGFRSIGLDLSKKAVKVVANNLFEEEVKGTCLVGDARQLPFGNAVLDGILAHHLFDHLDREGLYTAFAECYRVLKPGAPLLMTCDTFASVRGDRHLTTREDGTMLFTGGPQKGLQIRLLVDTDYRHLTDHGWEELKNDTTPGGSRIAMFRRRPAI
ncbi:MAG TPA: methyltransferase domain-containing protein [Candidatus Ozemobacteraceae bacterium]|nr:methyltransferase domain-containing protein [Candidatus Ozemobacteraceae bacterium]